MGNDAKSAEVSISAGFVKDIAEGTWRQLHLSGEQIARNVIVDTDMVGNVPLAGPFLGSLLKAGVSIRDNIFANKLIRFLSELENMGDEAIAQLSSMIESDPSYADNVGTHLVTLIDKFEDLLKPRWLAKIFGAYIKGEIDDPMFNRLGVSVSKAFSEDIKELLEPDEPIQSLLIRLVSSGFSQLNAPGGRGAGSRSRPLRDIEYQLAHTGYELKRILSQTT